MTDISVITDFGKDSLADDDSAPEVSDQVVSHCFSEASHDPFLHLYGRDGSCQFVPILCSNIKEDEMGQRDQESSGLELALIANEL